MKINLTEKQLKMLLSNVNTESELGEQEAEGSSTTAYPEVGKWESGITRGPANQIGNTKWSETVGSTLNRGKANKLK